MPEHRERGSGSDLCRSRLFSFNGSLIYRLLDRKIWSIGSPVSSSFGREEVMSEGERETTFRILCISCGAQIREDKVAEASGLCLKCFYRMLKDRFRAQKRARAGEGVSD